MESIPGYLTPLMVYAVIFFLNIILPGRWVTGYVNREGSSEKLRYRLNGLMVLVAVITLWIIGGKAGWWPWDWFYTNRWEGLIGAVIFGIVFSMVVVLRYAPVKRSFLADFYLGRKENLQLWGGRVDAKMWLYLVGAIMLELNALSFTAHHVIQFGESASYGVLLCAALLTWFVFDYLTFEEVHLYTYDLFAERVGFKLGWGCIAFYPFFYAIPLWATVDLPDPGISAWWLILSGLVFFTGWALSRGANLQKYYFKKDASRPFLGLPSGIITDGQRQLLTGGFWGVSRHVNYLGEILMATGIVLSLGYPGIPWPWLYPLYYVLLLFPRQIDDDKRCAAKYGPLWDQYKSKVKYKIIPYIY